MHKPPKTHHLTLFSCPSFLHIKERMLCLTSIAIRNYQKIFLIVPIVKSNKSISQHWKNCEFNCRIVLPKFVTSCGCSIYIICSLVQMFQTPFYAFVRTVCSMRLFVLCWCLAPSLSSLYFYVKGAGFS